MLLYHTCDSALPIVVNAHIILLCSMLIYIIELKLDFHSAFIASMFTDARFISIAAQGNDGQYIQDTQCGRRQLKWASSMLHVTAIVHNVQNVT